MFIIGFVFSDYQVYLFNFILLINLFTYSLCEHEQISNNNCPHLFKTLTDCTCVQSNTIDCRYSRTLTHLPRSWRSTNNNLTTFTQSITRFDLIHTPSITSIKTDDFSVNRIIQWMFIHDEFSLGSLQSRIFINYKHRS